MSRPHRPTPRARIQLAFCLGFVCAAALPGAGCSVNARFQAGTGTTPSNSRARELRPAPQTNDKDRSNQAAAHERTRRRRAQEDIARIDREAKERVDQAEREAAEHERAAEAEAERERQQAAADAEQRKRERERENEAAAKADKAQKPLKRRAATGRFDVGTEGATGGNEADEVFQRRNTEIAQSNDDKKAAIRKQLEKNKSDILVAAERKRTAVQESIKDDPEKQP